MYVFSVHVSLREMFLHNLVRRYLISFFFCFFREKKEKKVLGFSRFFWGVGLVLPLILARYPNVMFCFLFYFFLK